MRRRVEVAAQRTFGARPVVSARLDDPGEPLERALFAFDDQLAGLERAFYRHLLELLDLDAVFLLEQDLWSRLEDLELFDDEQVLDLANAIVARAFERLGHDPARTMKQGVISPDGRVVDAPQPPHVACPFCAPPPPSTTATAAGSAR